ncbi:glycosyltransferase involved in cell wall biosynthesis [Pararhizobium capsulatum DSM 1112]|uniref:Glycosyltransferase involved in cell wall biosynthesis n=1 Tax=Pararhizobium capsulatum DSM 1112 TaxID=1121113 RepID=A0ABU0BN44_9HYPH|nr:glycosyltransferase family 4 protein [Pararhizobium capsulatum]MDQ0319678.1 glycosyltransferase involved in cell wall biosynthesis [Pararhizobium capsulatum DSM 1112]
MKILILSSEFYPFRGGIGTYAMEMAKAASEAGHEVTVVAADYGGAEDQNFPFRILRYPGGQHRMRDIPKKIALVLRLAREEPNFDIVHAADWPFYLPLALSRYRGRSRCILAFHGTEVTFLQHPKRALPLAMLRFWNGWADYVANSTDTAERLRAAFGLTQETVRIARLGVGRAWLSGRRSRQEARQTLAIPPQRFLIASLGRVVPRKGYDLLAEALAQLPPEIAADIEWQIIGPFIRMAYADRLKVATARLACRTIITGELPWEEVALRLSAADLFCLPGQRLEGGGVEGFGLVYLEAGALGLPSLATDIGGISDAIDHGEGGLLVPPNDPAALAGAILELYRNPAERARLAAGALRRAQASSWGKAAAETYGYDSAIPGERDPEIMPMHEALP